MKGAAIAGAAMLAGLGAPPDLARAAESAAAPAGAVELPPMMVEESVSSVPWLYVNAGGTEFLSRCSSATTRDLAEAWLGKLQLVRAVIPEEFLVRMDVPAVFVLYGQEVKQAMSAEIQRELQGGADRMRVENRINIAPSMRLADRDMHASIAYIDETLFDGAMLSIAPSHVRYLLSGRVPELPAWLVEGMERLWQGADFVAQPITLRPLVWMNATASVVLADDASAPRALLPARELFTGDSLRGSERARGPRAEVRASTQELFVRWALVAGGSTRDALWKLAARSAEEPVTEAMFEEIFGFGFSELRDRLSDYLPKAVRATPRLDPGPKPSLPPFEVERATPNQIARIRGEWERLAIGHVQRRMPRVREPYIAQARRTLRRAYDTGDRDPRLLATMGLCEIDAGSEETARPFLEAAVQGGVIRPRAYGELARLRFAELSRGAPEAKTFSYLELAPVLDPLRRALAQAPALPEIYELLARAWERCDVAPTATELAELELGARLFGQRPSVAYPVALALARHGKKAEAAALLDAVAIHVRDEPTRALVARLRGELPAATNR